MTEKLRNYLEKVDNLAKLEPSKMPLEILLEYAKLSTNELFKACAQCVILRHNLPQEENILTLSEDEIEKLTISYAKEIVKSLKNYKESASL